MTPATVLRLKAAAGVLLAAVALVLGAYSFGLGQGEVKGLKSAQEKLDQYKKQVEERDNLAATLVTQFNDRYRAQEKAHEQRIAQQRADYARADAKARERDARTIADLRGGNLRLRLQLASHGADQAGCPGGSAPGADGDGRGELAPATSAALWSIAADGDRAIRKLTALQKWAASAVQLCGKEQSDVRPQPTQGPAD